MMVPISTRTAEQAGTAGNQVSAMVATIGTDIADPSERLAAVHESTTESKAIAEAVGARTLAELLRVHAGGLAGAGRPDGQPVRDGQPRQRRRQHRRQQRARARRCRCTSPAPGS